KSQHKEDGAENNHSPSATARRHFKLSEAGVNTESKDRQRNEKAAENSTEMASTDMEAPEWRKV
ncbi:hypothetical protein Ancab_004655, partial [Ancistrocladus abbreviatus]